MPPLELTLVVAATRSMGIGANGTLPWTGLKKEMAYFARVTKRLPPQAPPDALNAVIMGRKTWDSIPAKFRPLKGRLNIVVTRSAAAGPEAAPDAGPVRVASLDAALAYVGGRGAAVGRVFVIGGAQVYAAAAARAEARRVLLTRVLADFDCDTALPLALADGDGSPWKRRSARELSAWVGEAVPEGVQEENAIEYEFQMWEKAD